MRFKKEFQLKIEFLAWKSKNKKRNDFEEKQNFQK